MMVDVGGGVVPGEDCGLWAASGEGDEVLGLGHVDGLPVYARRHTDDGAASVAEGDRVDGVLHAQELSSPLPANGENTRWRRTRHLLPSFQYFSLISLCVLCLFVCLFFF